VRIPSGKLDALLAGSGELLVARRRAAACGEEVAHLQEDVRAWRSEWRHLEKALRHLQVSQTGPVPRRAAEAFSRASQRLRAMEQRVEQLSTRVTMDARGIERAAGALDDGIRRARLFPFSQACDGLDRIVRDLAVAAGKQVDLAIGGSEIELDRLILESVKDPVLHLVRNAVDHGVESPDERRALGKPPRATVTISAALREDGVEIVVADDGRGLDLPAIRDRARSSGLPIPDDDRDAARLALLPGLSTASVVTELSGRGVGLDVVSHGVQSRHGHVDISFEPGRGTRVALTLPLTVTTVRALLVDCGGQTYAVPATGVRRLVRVGPADLASAGGREVLLSEGAPVPVVSLGDILASHSPHHVGRTATLLILAAGSQQAAIAVDALFTEEEVLVKNLGARLRRVPHIAGATLLPSGRVALVLNTAAVVHSALSRAPGRSVADMLAGAGAARRRLLVADDSVTTRSLERSLLEAAGYEVLVAGDGRNAWRVLQESGADLVVADVEMPYMDGFALCQAIRGSARFRELPVVLVTALESEEDRRRGMDAGADAYLPKSAFDQRRLIETIARLL
jgi:two-component system chemotaxis sensor kinase CheA